MTAELELTDVVIEEPAVPALTLAYAQDHIQALGSADANLVAIWIGGATSFFEGLTGRQVMTATREAWLDAFPFVGATGSAARIELPRPPLQAVVSVKYIDSNGVLQSLTDGGSPATNLFTASAPSGEFARRGWVEPIAGQAWPIARAQTGAVRIRYRCGYGDTPDNVPELARGILCYLVANYDQFRAAAYEVQRGQVTEVPYGVTEMVKAYKYSALSSQVLRPTATVGQVWP